MGTKARAIASAAILAGIWAVSLPANAKAIPEGLRVLMAEGAGRAVGIVDGGRCAQLRNFYKRYGREHTIEIARLNHTDAEIEVWRRVCMPDVRPISR